jgi:hypothetical protein
MGKAGENHRIRGRCVRHDNFLKYAKRLHSLRFMDFKVGQVRRLPCFAHAGFLIPRRMADPKAAFAAGVRR